MPTPARSNTLRSMTGMVQYVTDLREKLESQLIEGQMIPELEAIFDRAERSLARSAGNFYSDLATKNGNIRQSVKNMQAGLNATERLRTDINKFIVRPGIKWGDKWAPISQQAGIDLAAANLEVRFMSQDQIDAAFRHLPRTATSGLFAGKERIHQIMGVVGDDVQKWFRSTVLDAITEGIPVQGPGDTLASRLIKSGRIRPLTIRTQKGGTITRSVVARANGIARVEMSRIMGDTQEAIAQDALGEDAMFINSNPRDSATTNICSEASREGAHPMDWWVESRFGRAPRFSPFHLCRSMLVGGREEWFDEDPVKRPPPPTKPKPRPKPKPKPKPRAKAKRKPKGRPLNPEGFVPAANRAEFSARMKPHVGAIDDAMEKLPLPQLNSILRATEGTLGLTGTPLVRLGYPPAGKKIRGYGVAKTPPVALGEAQGQVHRVEFMREFSRDAPKYAARDNNRFNARRDRDIASARLYIDRLEQGKKNGSITGNVDDEIRKAKLRLEIVERKTHWSTIGATDDPLFAAATHEFLHAVDSKHGWKLGTQLQKKVVSEEAKAGRSIARPTDYSTTNARELWTETGTALAVGLPIDPVLESEFLRILGTITP